MKKLILLVIVIFSQGLLSAQQFMIDPGHTAVVSKVMRFEVVKVIGRFTDVKGTINYNSSDNSKITAEILIKSGSYSANNSDGEKAIKSAMFLDVENFPEIKFVTKSMAKSGNGFKVVADLTLHGVTKEISFMATLGGPALDLPTGKQSIGISGTFTINRQDFGIRMAGKLPNGGMVVGNDVEIEINALAIAK